MILFVLSKRVQTIDLNNLDLIAKLQSKAMWVCVANMINSKQIWALVSFD